MRPGLVGHRVRKRPDNMIVGDSVSEGLKAARMAKEAASGRMNDRGWRCGIARHLNAERLRPAGFSFVGMPPRR
jgi:hypothetical protein